MHKAHSAIAPEGYPIIFLTAVATLGFAMLGCPVLTIIGLILVWFSLHFFRDPERLVPKDPDVAVSPADGKIVLVEPRVDPMTGEKRTCVAIFMNVFSVHVNRTPVAGTVEKITYWPGKFFNASLDKASIYNERCGYSVRAEDGATWSFIQIAGLIARRIVVRAEEGDSLARGERVGMIRFGSRVDLYIPDGYVPEVSVGRHVFAGQTILAHKK